MAAVTNRPRLDRLHRQLAGANLDGLSDVDETLQEILEASIAWIEDETTASFDPTVVVAGDPFEGLYDGNSTNQLTLRHRPILRVDRIAVQLPVLALRREYTPDEIKVYAKQGIVKVFTYKLMAEFAFLRLDDQVYGNIFPTLPQCVQVGYVYGFPLYDPEARQTSLDGVTWTAGDTRDRELVLWVKSLQQAAVCDAAASVLAQIAALGQALLTSVSFDGFSQGVNAQAYGPQVQALIAKRDEILGRRRRRFTLTSVGG